MDSCRDSSGAGETVWFWTAIGIFGLGRLQRTAQGWCFDRIFDLAGDAWWVDFFVGSNVCGFIGGFGGRDVFYMN